MSWTSFLQAIGQQQHYALTPHEMEVILCLQEEQGQTKHQLLEAYQHCYSAIEEEAFTQRLRTIYRKFGIDGRGYKLPQLHRFLISEYRQSDPGFSRIGLVRIHDSFPTEIFADDMDGVSQYEPPEKRRVDILQTFAPNLDHYRPQLIRCLRQGVRVRVLLAWPYSQAARLREEVLKRYTSSLQAHEIDIQSCVIANLETLEQTIRGSQPSCPLEIRLYDTLPSLAIYRAGHTMIAAPFLHGSLAIHTFQLELDLQAANPLITGTLLNDFELMWDVARPFAPLPDQNWRNDLKILFAR